MQPAVPAEADRYADGGPRLARLLDEALVANLRPPPKLRLSEWADRYAVLSKETSAQTGRFHAFPYQVGMMDAVTDPLVQRITVMKSARVGYTKILDHVVGYYVHQDPSPILVVQPRVEDAEDYSGTEIEPMLRDTPVLAEITGDLKAKDAKQKLLKRVFRNGASIAFVGANSPGGFRRITSRVVLFDEVDGYPVQGAGNEGDQIKLGIKRSESFWNRRVVLGSTPTVKGVSRIEKSWLTSDQRRFFVPCPHCGEMQVLEWGGPATPHGIKWDKDADDKPLPETAHYVGTCGHMIEEADKPAMVAAGEWRATAPFTGHAGFHVWTAYSLFPNAAWANLVAEWLEVKNDPLARQTFVNTVLGEPYEDWGDKALQEDKLMERREPFAAEVPDGVAVVTAGVDTQDDRLEVELVGWGRDYESWSVDYRVISGDPADPDTWRRLDDHLLRKLRRADGRPFEVMATGIDSGGHHTQRVYEFAKARLGRRVWALKGAAAQGGKRSPVWPTVRLSAKTRKSFKPIIVGVNAAKDLVRRWLQEEKPGPGYTHVPADRQRGWFSQLIAERLITKRLGGVPFKVWELPSHRTNEALDCRVYALAALKGLEHHGLKLNLAADAVGAATTPWSGLSQPAPPELEADASPPSPAQAAPVAAAPAEVVAKAAMTKRYASRLAR